MKRISTGTDSSLQEQWWWFKPEHGKELGEAALAWEMVRRTKGYPLLWERLREHRVETPMQLLAASPQLRERLGRPYFDFLIHKFDPSATWLELHEWQRLKAKGFVVGTTKALKINPEYVLPRQVAEEPDVNVGMIELGRGDSNDLRVIREIRGGPFLKTVSETELFRKLAIKDGRYVALYFDIRCARDALLRAAGLQMVSWLGTEPPVEGRDADSLYWQAALKGNTRVPIRWDPDTNRPTEFWQIEICQARTRIEANEFAIIPSEDPGYAVFIASERYGPAPLLGKFNSILRRESRSKWEPLCVEYWKTLTSETSEVRRNPDGTVQFDGKGFPRRQNVVRALFDPEIHLPNSGKTPRNAKREKPWLGIAANEILRSGRPLGKNSPEGSYLLSRDADWTVGTLHNAQRSMARRLEELDQEIAAGANLD